MLDESETKQVHPLTDPMNMEPSNLLMDQPNVIGNVEDNNLRVNIHDKQVKSNEEDVSPMQARSRRKESKAKF